MDEALDHLTADVTDESDAIAELSLDHDEAKARFDEIVNASDSEVDPQKRIKMVVRRMHEDGLAEALKDYAYFVMAARAVYHRRKHIVEEIKGHRPSTKPETSAFTSRVVPASNGYRHHNGHSHGNGRLTGVAAAEVVSEVKLRSMLNEWALPNKVVLGDATVSDLVEWSAKQRRNAIGTFQSAAFMRMVADRGADRDPDTKVREFLTEHEARDLWNAASRLLIEDLATAVNLK